MAGSAFTYSLRDFDSEVGRTRFQGDTINAANFDAMNTLITALAAAIQGVTTGAQANDMRVYSETPAVGTPADQWSQREIKWLVSMYDATAGKRCRVEIPTADLALLDATSDDPNVRRSLDLTAGAGLALKDAIEAYHKPFGNAVTVESVIVVGRNT